jgi:hypothetical protein
MLLNYPSCFLTFQYNFLSLSLSLSFFHSFFQFNFSQRLSLYFPDHVTHFFSRPISWLITTECIVRQAIIPDSILIFRETSSPPLADSSTLSTARPDELRTLTCARS